MYLFVQAIGETALEFLMWNQMSVLKHRVGSSMKLNLNLKVENTSCCYNSIRLNFNEVYKKKKISEFFFISHYLLIMLQNVAGGVVNTCNSHKCYSMLTIQLQRLQINELLKTFLCNDYLLWASSFERRLLPVPPDKVYPWKLQPTGIYSVWETMPIQLLPRFYNNAQNQSFKLIM